ncbi:hypothetical protein GT347_25920 [Xylophilus rhododendri]|uniref:Uncharacterized protein n=1 Tax=Xylophilus rhododendri TaxID=2697032 RepID=A0A857JAS4_9BURK|nr:hypothetical protein [Xylophilus rhododendri]QHJ01121.1 hypothetical protein GT347_25920 [Xylophilus rhododendri]
MQYLDARSCATYCAAVFRVPGGRQLQRRPEVRAARYRADALRQGAAGIPAFLRRALTQVETGDLHPVLANAIARLAAEMWRRRQRPTRHGVAGLAASLRLCLEHSQRLSCDAKADICLRLTQVMHRMRDTCWDFTDGDFFASLLRGLPGLSHDGREAVIMNFHDPDFGSDLLLDHLDDRRIDEDEKADLSQRLLDFTADSHAARGALLEALLSSFTRRPHARPGHLAEVVKTLLDTPDEPVLQDNLCRLAELKWQNCDPRLRAAGATVLGMVLDRVHGTGLAGSHLVLYFTQLLRTLDPQQAQVFFPRLLECAQQPPHCKPALAQLSALLLRLPAEARPQALDDWLRAVRILPPALRHSVCWQLLNRPGCHGAFDASQRARINRA